MNEVVARSTFLEKLGNRGEQFCKPFDHLSDTFFFVKDIDSRMIFASTPLLNRLGMEREEEIIGKTDDCYFPRHVAQGFVRDDRQVIASQIPLINRLESWYGSDRVLDWFVTCKYPVFGQDGRVIGIMGTVSSYEGKQQAFRSHAAISPVVDLVRREYAGDLTVESLADFADVSVRQLQRRFQSAFGIGVKDFIIRTRIRAACAALIGSSDPIAKIAVDAGFCDQSALTVQFRRHIGQTPAAFRRENRSLS
ncbi:Bifunctional transcriptional activator/DNA repair enzyme AdaA [Neorhodopirellula pilleata]|uniref:Bifunctional transcriptional activator/DNA repair enzyme AdaA n=2 Tax=Neorhodopirellula pilleata TaxID=2714738 RepID=A0A5C5ZCY2_9BACT|nr:Bifunctional transcriptional activator/DNA repair enzyme AdaA [Neorhodopirellula pilleata]